MSIWVRGTGVVTPAGTTAEVILEALQAGTEIPRSIQTILDPVPKRQLKMMSRASRLAAVAVDLGLHDAGVLDGSGVGYFMGVGASGCRLEDLEAILQHSVHNKEFCERRFGDAGLRAANPLLAFHLMNNFTMCHAAIHRGLTGPNAALYSRGAGTQHALRESLSALEAERAEVVVAGGADDACHPVTFAELTREGFVDRDFVGGQGAAVLVLGKKHGFATVQRAIVGRDPSAMVDAESDVVVAAGWSSDKRFKDAVHLAPILGDALAATPAIAWCVGLQYIKNGAAKRVNVVTAGVDGQYTSTVFSAAATPKPRRRKAAQRAVVTGVGVVSPFGFGTEVFWDALAAGRSAVRPVTSFDASTFETQVAAEVPRPWPNIVGLPHGAERDSKITFGWFAALEAWRSAGLPPTPQTCDLVVALGLERALLEDFVGSYDNKINWEKIAAGQRGTVQLRTRVDLLCEFIAERFQLRGQQITNVSACAAGASAFATSARQIERGESDLVLCGGADSMINPMGLGGMSRLGAPSPRNAEDACRPFDKNRDGLVIGEGAAMFILESESRAKARGATIHAYVLGHATTQDAYRVTTPRPDGKMAALAIETALQRASNPKVDWVNAHGTGTPLNDVAEASAINRSIRDHTVPVSSIKGAIGHLMAASGAIEIASCLLPFQRGVIPGTAHLRERDPQINLQGRRP